LPIAGILNLLEKYMMVFYGSCLSKPGSSKQIDLKSFKQIAFFIVPAKPTRRKTFSSLHFTHL